MNYEMLGKRIRMARRSRFLTQEQLAEEAHLTAAFVGHIERGTRKASLETLVLLANALNASVDELLQDSLDDLTNKHLLNETRQSAAEEEVLQVIRKNARYLVEEEFSWK